MSDEIISFPRRSLGAARSQAATFESELDRANPFENSLRALLIKRRDLSAQYGSGDGSVREVEREIADRVAELAGELPR